VFGAARERRIRLPRVARADLLALASLVLLVLLLFAPVVFGGRVFYYRDIHLQWHGQVEAFVDAIAAGGWPTWNPYVSFGQPLWANPNVQAAYPFTWLNLLLRPWTVYTLLVVGHVAFSAAGAFLASRRLGFSATSAAVAAGLWSVSGPFLSLASLWNHLIGASWIPWSVLAALVAVESGRLGGAAVWGATVAAPVLAGSVESALMAVAAAAACLPGLAHLRWRRLARSAAWAAVFAAGLSAAQWMPSLALLERSARASLPEGVRVYWSLHPLALAQALLPVIVDDLPLAPTVRAVLFESREPFLRSLYLGLPALGLVLAAFTGGRRRLALALTFLAVVAAALALGRHTAAYRVAAVVVPPLQSLRFPAKVAILVGFAWSLLAGLGVEAWRQAAGRRRTVLLAALPPLLAGAVALAGAAALVWGAEEWGSAVLYRGQAWARFTHTELLAPTARGLAVSGSLATLAALALLVGHRSRAAAIAGLAAVMDLAWTHHGLNPTAPREILTRRPPALAAAATPDRRRSFVFDYLPAQSVRYLGRAQPYLMPGIVAAPRWMEALGMRGYLVPLTGAPWRLEGSYERDLLELYPTPLARLTWLLRNAEGTPAYARLLQMGAVSRVVSLHPIDGLRPLAIFPSLFPEPVRVLEVPDPLPRTYAVGGARVADDDAALALLRAGSFDFRREILLPEGRDVPPPPEAGTSRIIEWASDRVALEAHLAAPGWVVLVDAYDPGWRVEVDSRPAALLRANLAFRAVAVPPARHHVLLRYRPREVLTGVALTLLTAAAAAAACWLSSGRARGPARPPSVPA
jgi:hypothetical protein